MKTSTRSSSSRRLPMLAGIASVLLLIVLALLTWLRSRDGGKTTVSGARTGPPTRAAAGPSPVRPSLPPGAVTALPPGVVVPENGEDPAGEVYGNVESVRRLMKMYEKANRYDPNTLRLTSDMIDVLMPNQFHPVTPQFVRARELESGVPDPPEERLYHRFWTDWFATTGADSVTLRFSAWQGDAAPRPAPVQIQGLEVFAVTAGGDKLMGALSLSETSAGNIAAGQYQVVFQPQALTKVQEHGYVRCVLRFQFPGEEPVRSDVLLHHTQTVPARFTGQFGEQLRDGNLVIKAGLEVATAGAFNLSLLLFDEKGETPVAYVNAVHKLGAGPQTVDFIFHGLVFHDANVPGPYRVTVARGYLQDDTGTGRGPEIPEWKGSFLTGPYGLGDFTGSEFVSPTKTATLEAYRRQIEDLERQDGMAP
ncbi:hypothetical protein KKD52_10820 [Myxococcota bacterium]|nr:hypothetical protein [Myxococcota bacterium]MBU1413181.1 hypothetical protein [Myxococcota bacterium]MBU1510843.1 hypothetical protein [Myxococcota bacterium]